MTSIQCTYKYIVLSGSSRNREALEGKTSREPRVTPYPQCPYCPGSQGLNTAGRDGCWWQGPLTWRTRCSVQPGAAGGEARDRARNQLQFTFQGSSQETSYLHHRSKVHWRGKATDRYTYNIHDPGRDWRPELKWGSWAIDRGCQQGPPVRLRQGC